MSTNYTKMFTKIQMTAGQRPEFPLDLLSPALARKRQGKPVAFVYEHLTIATTTPGKTGPAFVYGGDIVLAPTFCVAASAPLGCTHSEAKDMIQDMIQVKINEYCKEMIQFEEKHNFQSSKEHRIIVSVYGISVYDDTVADGYYGWDEIGFLILRK